MRVEEGRVVELRDKQPCDDRFLAFTGLLHVQDFAAFWEAVLAVLLLIGAALVVMTNYKQIHEVNIFAGVLVVQSLPFLAAVAIALIEGSRFNQFAYWRTVEAKVAETLPRPTTVAESPVQVPSDKRVEPAQ